MASQSSVFVTGATGYVGRAVASALASRGHDVTAMVRGSGRATDLAAIGVASVDADLRDLARLGELASAVDRVVHCAFAASGPGDDLAVAIELERNATQTLMRATQRRGSLLVYTSGIGVLAATEDDVVTEDSVPRPGAPMRWRYDLERLVAEEGGCVVRPALVYGNGGNALIVDLIRDSLARGGAGYLGEGDGALPTVHVEDLADAYVRVVEAEEPGLTATVVGETTTSRAIARAIGRLIGRPEATSSLPADVVARELPTAQWITGHIPVKPTRLHQDLGWSAKGPSLVDDIETGSYVPQVRDASGRAAT